MSADHLAVLLQTGGHQPYTAALLTAVRASADRWASRGNAARSQAVLIEHRAPDGSNLLPSEKQAAAAAMAGALPRAATRIIVRHGAACAAGYRAAGAGERQCRCTAPQVDLIEPVDPGSPAG